MKRKLSIDFLRTLIIVESILLHLKSKMDVGFFAFFRYVQLNVFKVGTFFFFVSGIMLYLVYYPRYLEDKRGVLFKLIRKGVSFFVIYFVYINSLRLINNESIPLSLYEHFYSHHYFAKVIFTFSFVFLLAPIFLYILTKINNADYLLLVSVLLMTLSHIVLNRFSLPVFFATSFFDNMRIDYPVVPMLGVYCVGVLIGSIFSDYQEKPLHVVEIYVALISFYYVGTRVFFIASFLLFWEIANVTIFVILVDVVFERLKLSDSSRVLNHVFLVGKRSLITFIGSNFIISLLPNLSEYADNTQIIVSLTIILTTYFLAWSYENMLPKNSFQYVQKGIIKFSKTFSRF